MLVTRSITDSFSKSTATIIGTHHKWGQLNTALWMLTTSQLSIKLEVQVRCVTTVRITKLIENNAALKLVIMSQSWTAKPVHLTDSTVTSKPWSSSKPLVQHKSNIKSTDVLYTIQRRHTVSVNKYVKHNNGNGREQQLTKPISTKQWRWTQQQTIRDWNTCWVDMAPTSISNISSSCNYKVIGTAVS